MFGNAIDEIKYNAKCFKEYWDTDSEFRKSVLITVGKGVAIAAIMAVPYVTGHHDGYRQGFKIGHEKGASQMARWMTNCLNEYDVKMPEMMRRDILSGKVLPWK